MVHIFDLRRFRKFILLIFCIIILGSIFMFLVNRYYPLKYVDIIKKYSNSYDLDKAFVSAVIHAESKFKHNAISGKNASGLMQIIESTAYWAADDIGLEDFTYDKIFNPEINIQIGCWYLSRLLKQYNGDNTLVLAAYNAGSGNVAKWLKNENYSLDGKALVRVPFKETENYIKIVNRNKKIYEIIFKWRDK